MKKFNWYKLSANAIMAKAAFQVKAVFWGAGRQLVCLLVFKTSVGRGRVLGEFDSHTPSPEKTK